MSYRLSAIQMLSASDPEINLARLKQLLAELAPAKKSVSIIT